MMRQVVRTLGWTGPFSFSKGHSCPLAVCLSVALLTVGLLSGHPTTAMGQIVAREIPPAHSTAGQTRDQNQDEDLAVLNARLEDRVRALRKQLMADVCADPAAARILLGQSGPVVVGDGPNALAAPIGPAPESTITAQQSQPSSLDSNGSTETEAGGGADQMANLPPATDSVASPMDRGQLIATMNQATVLVLAQDGTGSGFFVSPSLVVTNHHVVEQAENGKVWIVGEALGEPRKGVVVASTGDQGKLGPDYALVQIEAFQAKTTLPFATKSQALQSVIATGYPGLLLSADQNFRDLLEGDASALPSLVFSEGSIMAVQSGAGGVPVLAHSADISGGNSGGPLVDSCGRVVGINTLVAVDKDQSRNAGYALASSNLAQWLQSQGITAVADDTVCRVP